VGDYFLGFRRTKKWKCLPKTGRRPPDKRKILKIRILKVVFYGIS
jgi:hypothetical protein